LPVVQVTEHSTDLLEGPGSRILIEGQHCTGDRDRRLIVFLLNPVAGSFRR